MPGLSPLYDYLNRLVDETTVSTANGTQQTGFAYDGDQAVFRFQNTSAGPMRGSYLIDRYLWNPQAVDQLFADEELYLRTDAESLGTLWALTDYQNSVRDLALRDADTGVTSVVDHRVYDSFGNVTYDRPVGDPSLSVDCIFGYTGQMLDQATGLQNHLNRWYDSSTGRWMSQDPLGILPDVNPYRYRGNNPMSSVDPSGLSSEPAGDAGDFSFRPWWLEAGAFDFDPSQPISPPEPSPLMTFAYAVGGADAGACSDLVTPWQPGGVRPPTMESRPGDINPDGPIIDLYGDRAPTSEWRNSDASADGPIIDLYGDRTPTSEWRAGNKGVGSL